MFCFRRTQLRQYSTASVLTGQCQLAQVVPQSWERPLPDCQSTVSYSTRLAVRISQAVWPVKCAQTCDDIIINLVRISR